MCVCVCVCIGKRNKWKAIGVYFTFLLTPADFIVFQNHRMFEVGGALWRSLGPKPLEQVAQRLGKVSHCALVERATPRTSWLKASIKSDESGQNKKIPLNTIFQHVYICYVFVDPDKQAHGLQHICSVNYLEMCHGVKEALHPSDSIDVHYEICKSALHSFSRYKTSHIFISRNGLFFFFFHSCNSGGMNLCIHYLHTSSLTFYSDSLKPEVTK